jgi:RNA polymerase sigma factor (sigma-70 family)
MPAVNSQGIGHRILHGARISAQIECSMVQATSIVDSTESKFEQLMSEVAHGSEDAVWELAETYTPYILRVLRMGLTSQVRRRVDSQDLAQMLWASVLLRRSELTRMKSPQELIAYLCQTAKNQTLEARRRYLTTQKYDMDRERSLEPFTSDDEERPEEDVIENRALLSRDPSPSQFASVRERWNNIMETASERDRRILQLRLEGHSYDEISNQLKINEATARRAIERLVHLLSK